MEKIREMTDEEKINSYAGRLLSRSHRFLLHGQTRSNEDVAQAYKDAREALSRGELNGMEIIEI